MSDRPDDVNEVRRASHRRDAAIKQTQLAKADWQEAQQERESLEKRAGESPTPTEKQPREGKLQDARWRERVAASRYRQAEVRVQITRTEINDKLGNIKDPETRRAEEIRSEQSQVIAASERNGGMESAIEKSNTGKEGDRTRLDFPPLSNQEWKRIRDRQGGLCALTGEPLNETADLHHIVPAKHNGIRNQETNAFVTDYSRNGVLVNRSLDVDQGESMDEAGPHLTAHGGNFNNGPAMPHAAFRYSHGKDLQAHRAWAAEHGRFADQRIWGDRACTRGKLQTEKTVQRTPMSPTRSAAAKNAATRPVIKVNASQSRTRNSDAFGHRQRQASLSKRRRRLTAENTRKFQQRAQQPHSRKR